MRAIYSLAQVRSLAILTMIDDDVYDIGSAKFEDLKRNFSAKDSDVFWSCMWSYARFFGYLNAIPIAARTCG